MLKVIIRSIKRKGHLEDHEWKWIRERIGKPMRIMTLNFHPDTDELHIITVRADRNCGGCITLFVGEHHNDVKYELVGTLQTQNNPVKTHAIDR